MVDADGRVVGFLDEADIAGLYLAVQAIVWLVTPAAKFRVPLVFVKSAPAVAVARRLAHRPKLSNGVSHG